MAPFPGDYFDMRYRQFRKNNKFFDPAEILCYQQIFFTARTLKITSFV